MYPDTPPPPSTPGMSMFGGGGQPQAGMTIPQMLGQAAPGAAGDPTQPQLSGMENPIMELMQAFMELELGLRQSMPASPQGVDPMAALAQAPAPF